MKKQEEAIPVEMVITPGEKPRMNFKYEIKAIGNLGKEIKISPKSHCTVNHPGYKMEMYVPSVCVTIGIGKDHTADLIMDVESWEALNAGEPVHITTAKEFKEKYVHKRKKQ
jgi:hypothetical protein